MGIEDVNSTPDESVTESYKFNFRGNNQEGYIILITTPGVELPYEVGKFYKFDLSKRRLSGMLSGAFIDREFNQLEEMDCR